jgi:hypothetical protein
MDRVKYIEILWNIYHEAKKSSKNQNIIVEKWSNMIHDFMNDFVRDHDDTNSSNELFHKQDIHTDKAFEIDTYQLCDIHQIADFSNLTELGIFLSTRGLTVNLASILIEMGLTQLSIEHYNWTCTFVSKKLKERNLLNSMKVLPVTFLHEAVTVQYYHECVKNDILLWLTDADFQMFHPGKNSDWFSIADYLVKMNRLYFEKQNVRYLFRRFCPGAAHEKNKETDCYHLPFYVRPKLQSFLMKEGFTWCSKA